MAASLKRLVYVHKGASSFVLNDQRILESAYTVVVIAVVARKAWSFPWAWLVSFVKALWWIPGSDGVVCQFAGHHSLATLIVAKFFGKPAMIISNGSDCVGFPSLNYGHFRKPVLAWSTRTCFRLCDRIVPLDRTLVEHVPTYHDIDSSAQGILHFCPRLKTPITVLGYGFDPDRWKAQGTRLAHRFITVASGADKRYVQILKGIDMILAVAPRFPECEFLVIGAPHGALSNRPANVIEVPFVPHDRIAELYGTAAFYLQLSISEGFGNALCEAMLCGCIPIVSNIGAMPRIVGSTGYVVPRRDADLIVKTISGAMEDYSLKAQERVRERIESEFPLALRSDGLLGIVSDVLARGGG
jgi:glycosyltransferase involved in cell wall biosynthesis